MTSSQNPLQGLVLTPQQQSLLFAALNSNRPSDAAQPTNGFNMSPVRFNGSPIQADGLSSFQNSPDLDYEYDFAGADSSFDYYDDAGQAKMIGDLPGAKRALKSESGDAESPEKRSHPDDEEEEGPGAKRRDSEEKMAKKPGRKPLTTEPTSKRKAQNRAAQRAFRERKEKHLKDLETKVQELEKLSEDANNEKEALRAQVDKMTVELNEYKKRLSMLSGGRPIPQGPASAFGSLFVNNLNDVNFQFEFPKFGSLPGPPMNKAKKSPSTQSQPSKKGSADHRSPSEHSQNGVSPGDSSSYSQVGLDSQSKQDLAALSSGLFTPPLNNGQGTNGSSVSLDSHYNMGGPTTTSSPSASSNSNMGGPNSSCGTSPESFAQSPMGFKPLDTLSTIGEEHPSLGNPSQGLGHFANTGIEDFTQWLPQNDFQFDPELFGGYRDPQENVLSQGFDEGFFNDAVDMDFLTPYNLPIPSPVPPKKDLISQIDAAKDADESTADLVLKCNEVWEKIQNCPKAKGGDFDLDGLCADLQKKAKCDGTGPVVSEKDFQYAIKKYICKEKQEAANIDAYAKTQAQS
jgi:AP-1-like factor